LFVALLLGIVLAATFFAGINVGADTVAKQALDQQLSRVLVDVIVTPITDWSTGRKSPLLSSENVTNALDLISGIDGVTSAEVVSSGRSPAQTEKNLTRPQFRVIGISEESRIRNGWIGGAPAIGENQTFVWAGSPDASMFHVGEVIPLNISLAFSGQDGMPGEVFYLLNLTVAGQAQFTDEALGILTGQYWGMDIESFMRFNPENLLIVSWEETSAQIVDFVYSLKPDYSYFDTTIYVFLDRDALVSPWDTAGSISRLQSITAQINGAMLQYQLTANNQLESILSSYQGTSFGMRFTFIVAALPVFFVAWYVGSTVSDVSFNMRRREIGLLLTKGFSRRQLFSMFLFEAALIGVVGGLLGILLSLTLSPLFVAAVGGQMAGIPVLAPESSALTVAFAMVITLLAAYRPARRASSMTTVDALKEYMYVEEVKPYKRLGPWLAFILGSFKIAVFLLGINFQAEMMRMGFSNILLFILLSIVSVIDVMLTYIGPFLFFWGFTKIFIRGSLKFQELLGRAARFLGDLGELATRSVQRNPARAAAVAFLIAFIIGYSFQVIGTLASEQDFAVRQTYFTVGADVNLELTSPINASSIMALIQNNLTQVKSTAAEYTFYASSGLERSPSMQLRGINPQEWLSAAFYENEFFSGNSVESAFQSLGSNNHTIILARSYATALNKKVGDAITIAFGDQTRELSIAGFYGTDLPQSQFGFMDFGIGSYSWSYVPEGLHREMLGTVGSGSARILIKLETSADGKVIADKIEAIPEVKAEMSSISSVAEQLEQNQSNFMVTGSLNILRLGVVFIVIAASVGTALVAFVSLGERRREASIMSVRGLSFRQMLVMLLTENLSVALFAMLLGAIVGLIVVRGTIASNNAFQIFSISPVVRHMVFPPDSLLILLLSFVLVFASMTIPVVLMAKIYSSRLERTVREV
jgi:ABC-type antimicrobial peptide transport system permease subunit